MEIQQATAGGNEKRKNDLVIEIREIVQRSEIPSSTRCRIHKVPRLLRKWKEEAYTPQVVSIGPFHHKNERLKAMEVYKERYFRNFVCRSKVNLEYLVDSIREMEESIRGCYAETIDLTSDGFVKMILVDACFILELFFQHFFDSLTENPMDVEPSAPAIMLDLLLLENQLPFFVFEKLHQLAFPSLSDADPGHLNNPGLLELSFNYFSEFNIQSIEPHPYVKIEHFTDLLRAFQIPPPEKRPSRGNRMINLLYTATQLHKEGVKFKDGKSESCFDIKFENGGLKIPSLELNDWTEVVARNIIALEETRYIGDGYFTDYFIFMDLLTKTRKDVDLLCDKKIFVDYLGDRYAVKSMINNLNKGILFHQKKNKGILCVRMREDYVNLCNELNCFYETAQKRWKAILKREFFATPSATVSTIVTVVIITALTLIQTVCSLIQATGPSPKPK